MFSRSRFIAYAIVTMMIVHNLCAQFSEPLNGPFKAKDVKDLAVNNNGATLYAADQTFLFKSTNEGISWAVTGVELASPLVVTCKPDAPDVVVVGVAGHLYRNTGGGSTSWLVVPELEGTNLNPLRLATSPVTTSDMCLGRQFNSSTSSFWYSTNGGLNWQERASFTYDTDVYGIAPDPSSANNVWVGGSSPTGADEGSNPDAPNFDPAAPRGVWMSTNKGVTWIDRKMGDFNVRAVAVNGSYVFAGTAGTGPMPAGRVFRSTNGGNTWNSGVTLGAATIVRAIRVRTDNNIFVATDNGVFLSTDNGVSFNSFWPTSVPPDNNVLSFAIVPTIQSTMYAGTSAELYKSVNSGTTWGSSDNGIGRMPVSSLAIKDNSIWTSSQQYSLVGRYTGGVWSNTTISGFPPFIGEQIIRHPTTGMTYLSGAQDSKVALYKSTNNGISFSAVTVTTNLVQSSTSVFKGFVHDPALNSSRAYVFGLNGVINMYASNSSGDDNYGASNVVEPPHSVKRVNALAIDRSSANGTISQIIYAGVEDDGLYKTTMAGSSWTLILSTSGSIRTVALNSTSAATALVAYAGGPNGLWRVTGTYADQKRTDNVVKIMMNPSYTTSSNYLWVIADGGNKIFRTSNGGATWSEVNTSGIPKPMTDISTDVADLKWLYVATPQGVYRIDPEPDAPTVASNQQPYNSHPQITWSESVEPDFGEYRIFRYNQDCPWGINKFVCGALYNITQIHSTTNRNETQFIDNDYVVATCAPGLGEIQNRVGYYVQQVDARSGVSPNSLSASYIIGCSEEAPQDPTKAFIGGRSDESNMPDQFSLESNFPNPFNPVTQIKYALPEDVHVVLRVFDVLGREVATLVDGFESAGYKSVEFNASRLPSGVYFYHLGAGKFSEVKKMLLAK